MYIALYVANESETWFEFWALIIIIIIMFVYCTSLTDCKLTLYEKRVILQFTVTNS